MPPATPTLPKPQAARSIRRLLTDPRYLVGGTVVVAALLLGAHWFERGRLDGRGLGLAAGLGVLLAVLAFLLRRRPQEEVDPVRRQLMKLIKSARAGRAAMTIQLCRSGLERLGPGREPLLTALQERGHSSVIRECLNRCIDCKQGLLMANVDSIPVCSQNPEQLLRDLDELDS